MPVHDAVSYAPELIIDTFMAGDRRVLLFGESGIGKSTLAAGLARALARLGRDCTCIGADPGSPAFGVPGAVCLGKLHNDAWQAAGIEALCTLDGGRFRLPLVSAVRRMAARTDKGMLLVDAPGVVRSVAGAELLVGLVEAAGIDTVLVLCRENDKLPLANELATLACDVVLIRAAREARSPGHRKRARLRTLLWDKHLVHAMEKPFTVTPSQLTGTPPPLAESARWRGRQVALLKNGRTLAMGEVVNMVHHTFTLRIGDIHETPDQFLCRDAHRDRKHCLVTVQREKPVVRHYMPPPDVAPYPGPEKKIGPRPVIRIGDTTATLVNGVFGDPLLHLRLHNRKRSMLFDLGEGGRLPAHLAHQVTDVFISHAHIDHISGFLWLMRSRIGNLPSCRLFGPPGLAHHIRGLLSGIHWDRIGELGPRFVVAELHNDRLMLHALQAGKQPDERTDERPAPGGLLLEEAGMKVRAVTLDHAGIPVLAYSVELAPKFNVRKDALSVRNLEAGPWLSDLKQIAARGDRLTPVQLPDGTACSGGQLADDLLQVTPAQKLVYATDLSDTAANREKLCALARKVETFFCEAAFLAADKKYAELSGHLTATACGEIALNAGVKTLVPFHFSRRYEKTPLQIYNEIKLFCRRVALPRFPIRQERTG